MTFNWPHIAYEVCSINGFGWCSCTSWNALFPLAAEHKRAGGRYGGWGLGLGGGACTLFVKLVRVHRPSSTTASRLFFLWHYTFLFACIEICFAFHTPANAQKQPTLSLPSCFLLFSLYFYTPLSFYPSSSSTSSCPFIHLSKLLPPFL